MKNVTLVSYTQLNVGDKIYLSENDNEEYVVTKVKKLYDLWNTTIFTLVDCNGRNAILYKDTLKNSVILKVL